MKRTGIRRLAVPSAVSLGIACVYFACVLVICRSAMRVRLVPVGDEPVLPEDSYSWKQPAASADKWAGADAEPWQGANVTLERLPGWPTEFPANLDAYREGVLAVDWGSNAEKHRMEVAPWVWHHRGRADALQAQLDAGSRAAAGEMARLGVVPRTGALANAAFVVLIRDRELDAFLGTMRQLEDRFNRRHHYPYVFLNDKPFSDKFMQTVAASTHSNVTFALIPRDHWSVPASVDSEQARRAREQMAANGVVYGGSLSYRHMCRFNSGFFYQHPVLQGVDWYWRVEPGVEFYCDIDYDPFVYMRDSGKLYSFVIALKEVASTVPTLWDHTLQFMLERNVTSDWMSYFVARTGDYNLCHFWSNFEIASLGFLRSEAYSAYFDYLDRAQGFFMERWGDAPVHSLAAGMLLRRDQVHFFDDIGYRHDGFSHCPKAGAATRLRCRCPPKKKNFDDSAGSCLPGWKRLSETPWTERDTREALRLVRERRMSFSGLEPPIALERRRWYDFFGAF